MNIDELLNQICFSGRLDERITKQEAKQKIEDFMKEELVKAYNTKIDQFDFDSFSSFGESEYYKMKNGNN